MISIGLLCQIQVLLMVTCILRCVRVKKKMLRTHFFEVHNVIGENVYKPDVPIQFIPFKSLIFKSLELVIKMYYEYAEIGGFDSRFDNKIINNKHVICNCGGKLKKKYCDTLGTSGVRRKQNSSSRVIGCQAKIIFESVYGTQDYKVFQFDGVHKHPLEMRSDLKKARQMTYSEKEFIVRASTSKIGLTMAHKLRVTHRLRASLRGGYEFLKPKVVDYKNLRTNINRVIGYKDAQMIFNCQYDVLDSMFWADEMEKAYYVEFGDVISFDVTFHTNKYQMFFVPITAIGHHKKISYCWNTAIKQAIENMFPNSKHRLCMWHIMKKLKNKMSIISDYLFTNKNFRKRFTKLVWDINMKPNVFEVTWGSLMKEFNLEYMRWFKDMFTKRDSWIPGYFNDIPMCRLVKTTSRLESMNSFFNTYSESGNLLLNFMMNYDTAIQKQRNTQREIDKTSNKASYRIQTPQEIEHKHQKFIQVHCFLRCKRKCIKQVFSVHTRMLVLKMGGKFTLCNTTLVKVNLKMNLRHAFTIMMRCGVKEIPERYILKRWRKDAISRNYHFSSHQSDSRDYENVKLVNDSLLHPKTGTTETFWGG
uniref:Protein FAR1-RELATED SEQUENCE n=1 Tax=Lactuca sativa TaxID=4236 RepID=A0A9R1X163_LACSA|nr:hypothetical protein LSAT_V11C800448690 [Lactuca sativa]